MQLVTRLIADGTLLLIVLIAVPVLLLALRGEFWTKAPVLVMAGMTSLAVGKILSLLYQPAVARPFLELGIAPGAAYIDNPGFPSDHALLATVAVVAVYALTRNRRLTAVLAVLVLIMCAGRVMAFVHTPLDVIGGILAGLSGAVWYKKLTK
jgi:membrane-associated phospholipid phosphatase